MLCTCISNNKHLKLWMSTICLVEKLCSKVRHTYWNLNHKIHSCLNVLFSKLRDLTIKSIERGYPLFFIASKYLHIYCNNKKKTQQKQDCKSSGLSACSSHKHCPESSALSVVKLITNSDIFRERDPYL